MAIIQNIIVERFLEDSISLVECTRLFIKARGIRKEVYQELFTIKILEADEMLSLDLLEQAMNQLEPEPLMRILRAKENSIYGYLASKTYMKMLFDVEEEVLEELKQKIKIDNE